MRPCAVCGKDQARKKVWEKYYKKVICYPCHDDGWSFWPDGSTYNRKVGPDEAQSKMWKDAQKGQAK